MRDLLCRLDISTMRKPAGVRCRFLSMTNECSRYDQRPAVCRGYRLDELCGAIWAPTLEERVARYRSLFDEEPAYRVRRAETTPVPGLERNHPPPSKRTSSHSPPSSDA
ncbi:MAG: hypothetical protein Fur0034_01370 [Desulfuromonadia bacterium]